MTDLEAVAWLDDHGYHVERIYPDGMPYPWAVRKEGERGRFWTPKDAIRCIANWGKVF